MAVLNKANTAGMHYYEPVGRCLGHLMERSGSMSITGYRREGMDWGLTFIFLACIVFAWYVVVMLKWLLGSGFQARRAGSGMAAHHAVTVVAGEGCCQRACQLRGLRLLSVNAPALPLKGCDAVQCACVYRHFEDRRVVQRRAILDIHGGEPDRRDKLTGRRQQDGLMPG